MMAREGERSKEEELIAATVLIEALQSASGSDSGREMQARHLSDLERLRSQFEARLSGVKAELNAERERCSQMMIQIRELQARQTQGSERTTKSIQRPRAEHKKKKGKRCDSVGKAEVASRIHQLRYTLNNITMQTGAVA